MASLKNKSVQAFSLIESIVAMLLILLVFMVCIKVFVEFNSKYHIQNKLIIQHYITEDLAQFDFEPGKLLLNSTNTEIELSRSVRLLNKNLLLIEYSALKDGREVYQQNEYRYVSGE